MTIVNALLVRYANGYTWVTDLVSIGAHGRREAFLQAGSANSVDEATTIGLVEIALRAEPQVAVRVAMDPTGGGDVPYADFKVGDDVTLPDESGAPVAQRIHALTVTEDEDGNTSIVPELNTLRDVYEQRLARWLDRMANGSLAGSSSAAAPLPPPGPQPQLAQRRALPPVVTLGAPNTDPSKPYKPPDNVRVVRLDTLTVGQTGATHLQILVNGVVQHAWVVALGDSPDTETCSVLILGAAGDFVQVQATDTGGASYISVTPVLG